MKSFLKKAWEVFKERFVWIIVTVFITAILDLIGLGTITAAGKQWNVGLGFILGFLLFGGFVIYQTTKKEV